MITQERIAELQAKGYRVENMGQEYGPEFNGMFRWVTRDFEEFQDYEPSYNETDAWLDADRHEKAKAS